ncbi:MAG: hypothetical protein KA807_12810 [Prolixibacteraceae bacterium]|nr:hypothetical protein [Prolixibacteraceae bacterium]
MYKTSQAVFFFILLLIPFKRTESQTLTAAQLRTVNGALLELINDYESYSRFSSDNQRINENYISLFTDLFDNEALLYNDIVPSNKVSDPVTLSQYISIFKQYFRTGAGVRLFNILFDNPELLANGKYRVKADLVKEIYGRTNNNVYYKDTIPLTFTFNLSISGNNIRDIRIMEITGKEKGRFLKFRIMKFLTLKPLENAEIKIDSRIEKTDSKGNAIIEDIDPNKMHNLSVSCSPYKQIEYSNIDIDEFIKGNTYRKHQILRLPYYDQNEMIVFMNTLNFSIAPVLSLSLPGMNTIMSKEQSSDLEFANLRERGSFSPRIGLRFGISLLRTNYFDLSLNTGIEKNYIRTAYMFDTCRIIILENHQLEVTDIYNLKQKITLNFTDVPLFISVDYKGFRDFVIGTELGIRFSRLNKSTSSVSSGYASNDFYDSTGTLTAEYHNFHSRNRFLSYQLGLTISKEILPSLKIYGGPTLFIFTKNWLENEQESGELLSSDKQLNNILNTYKRSELKYVAIEFGIKYNFSSIKLK